MTRKLSDLIATRTAGALPSSRTFGQTEAALASDNIEEVKAQLSHVWAHYQALEYIVHDRAANAETIRNALADETVENDVEDLIDLVTGYFATGAIEIAYGTAHSTLPLISILGLDVQAALRELLPQLDYSDPERELSDSDLAALLGE